ncbi:hypothetical protein Emed_001881 [Eimeria media]
MAKEERQGCLLQGPRPSSPSAPLLESEDSLALMQSSIERTTRRLELEKRRLYDLSDALEKAQAEYDEKRTRYSYNKSDAMQELSKAEKHLRLLENRVAQATSKHNVVTSAIADLRSSIDKHRKDRLSLDQVNRYLTREIQLKEIELKALQAEMASQVDEEQQTLSLKGRICEVREKEREEFRKLTIEKEKILRDHERELKTLQAKSDKGQEYLCAQIRCNDFTVSAEERLRYAIRQHKKQMEVFERAMDSIKASTGISDADEIVRIFTLLEERNFSAITYVNTINQEIKDMENRKKAIMERIQEHLEHGGKAEKITQELLNEVKDQIQSITHQMEVREERILAQTQALDKVRVHVSDCVSLIEREASGFQPPQELAIKEAGSANSLIQMLQYVESFVTFKVNQLRQSGFTPSPASSARGWGGGPQQKAPEAHEHRDEAIRVPSIAHLAMEPRLSTKHRGTASIRPKSLPSAHADSGSDDFELCERPLTDMELRTRTAQSFIKRRRRDQRGSEKRSLLSDSSRPDTPESRFSERGDGLRGSDCAEGAGGACIGAEAHLRLTHLMRDHSPRASITEGVLSSRSLQLPLHQPRTRSKTTGGTPRPNTRRQQQGRPSRNDLQASPRSAAAYEQAQPAPAPAAAATEASVHARSRSAVLSADAGSEAGRLGPPATSAADPAEGALPSTQQQEDIPFAGARQLSLEEAAAPIEAESRGIEEAQESHEPDESSQLPEVSGLSASNPSETREEQALPDLADREEEPPTGSRAPGVSDEQTAEGLVQSSVEEASSAKEAAVQQHEGEEQDSAEQGTSAEAPNESLDCLEDPIPAADLSSTDAREACESQELLPVLAAAADLEGERTDSDAMLAEVEEAADAEAHESAPSSLPQEPSEKADACSPNQTDDIGSPVVDVVSDGGDSQQPKASDDGSPAEPEASSTYGVGTAVSPTQAQELEGQQPSSEECTHFKPASSEEEETATVHPASNPVEEGPEGSDMDASNTVEASAGPAEAAALAAPALAVAPEAPASAEVSPKICVLEEPSPANPRDSGTPLPEDEGAAARQLLQTEETASALQQSEGEGHHQGLKSSAQHQRLFTGPVGPRVSFYDGLLPGQAEDRTHEVSESFRRASRAERQETASKAWLSVMAEEQQGQAEGGGLSAGFSEEGAHEEAELGEALPTATPQPNSEMEEAQEETEETLDHCRPSRASEGSASDAPRPSSPSPSDEPSQTSQGSAAHDSPVPLGEADALVQPELDSEPAAPASNEHVEDECEGRDSERALPCSFSHVVDGGDSVETRFPQREEDVSMQQSLTAKRASVAASAAVAAATSAAAARTSSLAGRGSLTIAAVAAAAAAACAAASAPSFPASSARGDQRPQAKADTAEDRFSHAQEGDASAEADEGRVLDEADAHEQLEGPPALESGSSCFVSHNAVVSGDSDDMQQQAAIMGLVEPQAAEAPAAASHAAAEAVAAAPSSTSEEAAGRRPQRFSDSASRSSILRRQSSANRKGDTDKSVLFLSSPDDAASTEKPDAPCSKEEHCPEERPPEEVRRTSRCSLLDREEGLTIRAARLGHGLASAEMDESPLEEREKTAEDDASMREAAAFEPLDNAGQVHISDGEGTAAAGGELVSADAAQAAEGSVEQPSAQQPEGALRAERPEGEAGQIEAAGDPSSDLELLSSETADKSSPQRSDGEATVEEGLLVRQGTPRLEETDEAAALRGAATDARSDGPTTAAAEAAVLDESEQLAGDTLDMAAAGEDEGERASSVEQPQAVECRLPSAEELPSSAVAAAAAAAASLEQRGGTHQQGGPADVQQSASAGERSSTEESFAAGEIGQATEDLQRPPSRAEGPCLVAAGEEEGVRGQLSTQLQPTGRPDSPGADSEGSSAVSPAVEGDGDTSPPTQPQTTPEHSVASGELEPQDAGRGPASTFAEGSSSAAADRAADAGLEAPHGLEGEPEGPPESDSSACTKPHSTLSSQMLAHFNAGLAADLLPRDSPVLDSSGFPSAAEAALEQPSPAAAAACRLEEAKALDVDDNVQRASAHDTSSHPQLDEAESLTFLPAGADAAPAGEPLMSDNTPADFSASADGSALSRLVVASGEIGSALTGDAHSGGDQLSSKDEGRGTRLFGADEEENFSSTQPPQAPAGSSADSLVRDPSLTQVEGFTATPKAQQQPELPLLSALSVEGSFSEAAAGQERRRETVPPSDGLSASPQAQDALVERADSQREGMFHGEGEEGEAERSLSPTCSLQPCVSSLEKTEASRFEAAVEPRVSPLAEVEAGLSGAGMQQQQQQQEEEGNASEPVEPPSCSLSAGRQQSETALGGSGNFSDEGQEEHAGEETSRKGSSFKGLPLAFSRDFSSVDPLHERQEAESGAEVEKAAAFGLSQELQQSTRGVSEPQELNDACSGSATVGEVEAAAFTELLQQEASAGEDGEKSPLLFCPTEALAGGAAEKAASDSFVEKMELRDADAAPPSRTLLLRGDSLREEAERGSRDVQAEAAAPAGAPAAEAAAAVDLPLDAANDLAAGASRVAAPDAPATETVQTAAGSSVAAGLEDLAYTVAAGSLHASPAADGAAEEVSAASRLSEAPADPGVDAVEFAAAIESAAEGAAADAAASESSDVCPAAPDAAAAAEARAPAADATAGEESSSASAAAVEAADAASALGAAADDAVAHEAADAPHGAAPPGEAAVVEADSTASADAAAATADSAEMLAAAATAGAALDVDEVLSDRAAMEAAEATPAAQPDSTAEPAVDSGAAEETAEASNAVDEPATRDSASMAEAFEALSSAPAAAADAAADAAAAEAAAAPLVGAGEGVAAEVCLEAAADAASDAVAALDSAAGAARDTAADADAPSDTATNAELRNDAAADAGAAASVEAVADFAADLPSYTAAADTAADADVAAHAEVAAAAEAVDLADYMAPHAADAPADLANGAEAPGAAADCREDAAAVETADAAAEEAGAAEAGAAAEAEEAAGEGEDEALVTETARADAANHVEAEAQPASLFAKAAADNARAARAAAEVEEAEAAARLPASDALAGSAGTDASVADSAADAASDAAADAAVLCVAAASADGGRDAGGDAAASAETGAIDAETHSDAAASAPTDPAAEAAAEAAAGGVPYAEAASQEDATAAGSPHAIEPPEEALVWQPLTDAAAGRAAEAVVEDHEVSACEQPLAVANPKGIEAAADQLQAMSLSPSPQLPSDSNAEAEEATRCMQQQGGTISDSVDLGQIDYEGEPQKREAPEGKDQASYGNLGGPSESELPPSEVASLRMSLSDALPSEATRFEGEPPHASPSAVESGRDSELLKRDQLSRTYSAEGLPPPLPSAGAQRAPSPESDQDQLGPPSQPTHLSSSQPLEVDSRSASKMLVEGGAPLSDSREASEATYLERALEGTRGPSLLPEEDAVAFAARQLSASFQGISASIAHSSSSAAEEPQASAAEPQQDKISPASPCEQGGARGSPSTSTDRSSEQERQFLEEPLDVTNRENHDQQLLQRAQGVLSPSQQSASAAFELSPSSAGAAGSQESQPQALPLSHEAAQEPEAPSGLHASPLNLESSSHEEALMEAQRPLDQPEEDPHLRSPQTSATLQQLDNSKNLPQPGEIAGGCSPLPSEKLAEAISLQGSLASKPAELASPDEAGGLQPSSASQDLVWDRLSASSQPAEEVHDSSSAPHANETGSPELEPKLSIEGGEATSLSNTGAAADGVCEQLEQLAGSPSSAPGLTDEAACGDGDLKECLLSSADKQLSAQLHASPGDQLQSAENGHEVERQADAAALSRISSESQPPPEQLERPVSSSPSAKPVLTSFPEDASCVAQPGGSEAEAASSSAAAEAKEGLADAAAHEGLPASGDEEAVGTTRADERQQQERSQTATSTSPSLSTLQGGSESQPSFPLNRAEPEGAPLHGQETPLRGKSAASGETRKLILSPESVSEAPAPRASTIRGIAPPGRSSWKSERVASLAGRASTLSPPQRVPEALDSLAASRRSEDISAEEETVIVDDLVVRHAPITAPLPAPRPLARVTGSKGSSSNSSNTSQTLNASAGSHQPSAVSQVPENDDHTTQRPEASSSYSAEPTQGPPSAATALETVALGEASDALQRPLSAQPGGPPFALRGAIPKPAPPSQFFASRPPPMRSATPLQPRPPPSLMRVVARPPAPPAPTLPLATAAPETAAAAAAAAQQRQQQSLGPVTGLPAALPVNPAIRPPPARPPPPQRPFLSPSWTPAEERPQGLPPVGARAEGAPQPQEGSSSSTSSPFKIPPQVLQPPLQHPVRPAARPAPPQDFRMPAGPPQAAVTAPPASQPQPRPPPFLLAAAAQLASRSEQQAMRPSTASGPLPPSQLQGVAAAGERPATAAADAAADCPPQRGPLGASLSPAPSVSSPLSAASPFYGRRPPPFPLPDSLVSTGNMGPLPPPRRPSPIGSTRPPWRPPTPAPPDSFVTPSLSSTNSLAVPIYASGRETPVSVRPPAGPPSPYPFSFAAAPAAAGQQPPRLASTPVPMSAAAALGLLQQQPPVAGRPIGLPPLGHEQGHAALPVHAIDQSGSRAPPQEPPASRLTSRLTSIRPPQNSPAAAAAAAVVAAPPMQSAPVSRPPQFSPAFTPPPAGPREARGEPPLTVGVQRPPGGPLLFQGRPATPSPAVSSATRPPSPPLARSQSPFPSGRPPAPAAAPWLPAPTAHMALSPATARPPQRPLPAGPPGSSAAPPKGPLDPPTMGGPPRPQTAAGPVPPWTTVRPPASLLGGPPHSPLAASRGASPVAARPPIRPGLPAGFSRPPTPMAPVAAAPSRAPFLPPDGLPAQLVLSSEGPPPHQVGPLMPGTGAPRPPVRPFLNPSAPVRPALRPPGLAEGFSRPSTAGLPSELRAAPSVPPLPSFPLTAPGRPPSQPATLLPAAAFRPVPAPLTQPSPANRQLLPKPDP